MLNVWKLKEKKANNPGGAEDGELEQEFIFILILVLTLPFSP